MARMARLVVPGYPHHITQRGNRRMKTFFSDNDYQAYLDLLVEGIKLSQTEIWAYCLMPNHVHLIAVPQREDSLSILFRHVHRKYSRRINIRENWKGHLWQERFHSFVMNEEHLIAGVRYVELNPVRAKLCDRPEDWHWSSARVHLGRQDCRIINTTPMLERIVDWDAYLSMQEDETDMALIRQHTKTGRPSNDEGFIASLEMMTGKVLRKNKPGPKLQVDK